MPFWTRIRNRARPAADASRAVEPPHTKASAAHSLIALQGPGQPVWSPRDMESFAREGMMQNAVVYRCVRMIADAAASIPLTLVNGLDDVTDHPLLDLLARPNAHQSFTDLMERWYGFLLITGNAFLEGVSLDGTLRELHVLRSDRMSVVPGPDGWPEAWEYTVAGRTLRFGSASDGARAPVLHHTLFHPANDHYGLAPAEAAASAIDIHNAASRWNKALLDNAAQPSGALVFRSADTRLTAGQFERLRDELTEKFAGARNAGRPLLLEGGLDWKTMALSPRDMDFIEAKHAAAREIGLAFGVPPMLLGIPGDNTYSNYQEANRTFWRQTVIPLVARTGKALSRWLSEGAPDYAGLDLRPNLARVEALRGERDELWQRIDDADFLTVNEKRAAVGYPPLARGDTPPSASGDGSRNTPARNRKSQSRSNKQAARARS